jgi:hypothetical protein
VAMSTPLTVSVWCVVSLSDDLAVLSHLPVCSHVCMRPAICVARMRPALCLCLWLRRSMHTDSNPPQPQAESTICVVLRVRQHASRWTAPLSPPGAAALHVVAARGAWAGLAKEGVGGVGAALIYWKDWPGGQGDGQEKDVSGGGVGAALIYWKDWPG